MFRPDQLSLLREGFSEIRPKADALMLRLVSRTYATPAGREYAENGVARRIQTIARCVERVYQLLPPQQVDIPERDILYDATINIQAAVFNTYGALDNLAFVWVFERAILGGNGLPLPNGRIGLTRDKEQVRASFSEAMQQYLANKDSWFANLESFRHSLGHRIPLYIPPYCIDPSNVDQYNDLEVKCSLALRAQRLDEVKILEAEQNTLRHFKPMMQHSLVGPAPPVVFHAQLLADFNTVEEVCTKILIELESEEIHGEFRAREFRGHKGVPGTQYQIGKEFRGHKRVPGTQYQIGKDRPLHRLLLAHASPPPLARPLLWEK
jgi:hypothetical protein